MEVEFEVGLSFVRERVEEMFRNGLANALNISVNDIVKLVVSEIMQPRALSENGQQFHRLRRLQSASAVRFEVSYEVLPPDSMDVDGLVSKANRITSSGSAEAQGFREVMTTGYGVAKVQQVVPRITARKFEDEVVVSQTMKEEEPENDATPVSVPILVLAACLGFIIIACAVVFSVRHLMFPRGRESDRPSPRVLEAALEEGCRANVDIVRTPSGTLLDNGSALAKMHRLPENFDVAI
jgi:hypothetical protein